MKNFITDGKLVGLAAFLVNKNDFLTDPRGQILYRNLDVLKSALHYQGYNDSHDYVIMIKVEDIMVEISKCRITNDGYIFYHGGEKYYVTEDRERRLLSVGYIVFEYDNYKKNIANAFNACMQMGLRKATSTYSNKTMRFKLLNNTGAINVCSVTTLVEINTKRKKEELKAIPFEKARKNNCIVVYADKDIYDNRSVEEEVNQTILTMVSMMKEAMDPDSEITYEPIELLGTLFIPD